AQLRNVHIGVFTAGLTLGPVREGMEEGLASLGYVAGKNITFIVEDTKGNSSDLAPGVAKLLSAKPDVLFTVSTSHAQAAKRATSTVPIVFAWVGDPIQAGLIDSYPYSKSNLTGVAAIGDALSGKRLEVLLEIAPKTKRLLVLVATKESVSLSSFRSLEIAAKKFGVQLVRRDVTDREEIVKALEETPQGSIDAIFHVPSTLVRANLVLEVKKSIKERIPLSVHEEALMDQGALFSFGPNTRLIGLQAANLVSKLLMGARPNEIMVETPDKFFLAINQAAAKQIGLKISSAILGRADRLIQ
ncbi:MAG TPA: ABC transporter substrate-binding protein, partial [Candidatus Binatus sp.]|nr:ABC transporter substrate-binding protein [Candidatus Binatus sp.]